MMNEGKILERSIFWTKFTLILGILTTVLGVLGFVSMILFNAQLAGVQGSISIILNIIVQIIILVGLFLANRDLKNDRVPEFWPYILSMIYLIYGFVISKIASNGMSAVTVEGMESAMQIASIIGIVMTIFQFIPPLMALINVNKLSNAVGGEIFEIEEIENTEEIEEIENTEKIEEETHWHSKYEKVTAMEKEDSTEEGIGKKDGKERE